jgi:hypothetical protein
MNELKRRWKAPTPEFWKKVQTIGIFAGSLGVVFIAPPLGLATIGGYLIATGSVIGVLSQLTVKDNATNK